jgi:hypothetical protein
MFDEERLSEPRRTPRPLASQRRSAGAWIGEKLPVGPPPQERARRRVSPRRPRDGVRIGLKRPEHLRRPSVPRSPAGTALRTILWEKETEAHFQGRVVMAAKVLGWKYVYHTFDSRRSPSGFPDLVMIHPKKLRLAFVELKSMHGRLTLAQKLWRTALCALSGVEYYTWKPSDWTELVEILKR